MKKAATQSPSKGTDALPLGEDVGTFPPFKGGKVSVGGARFSRKNPAWIGIAVSRFNPEVTSRLLESCLKALGRGGFTGRRVKVLRVPGGFELPWAAQELARRPGCAAVVAIGCILQGETSQNEHIARSAIQHLHDVALSTRVPVLLSVLTPKTYAQALARAKGKLDRGREAAEAALEMVRLKERL